MRVLKFGVVVALSLLAACEEKGGSASSGGGGGGGAAAPAVGQTTPDNPSTYLGKTAKMARDTKGLIDTQQQATLQMAQQMSGEGKQAVAPTDDPQAKDPTDKSGVLQVAGVSFVSPEGWIVVPVRSGATSMSPVGEFKVEGEDGPARVVFFNTGGSTEANIERWKGMVREDDGSISRSLKLEEKTYAGLKVTILALEGNYAGMTSMGTPAPMQSNQRFLGVVVEGPRGSVQVRMTGPVRTVKAAEPAFRAMIQNINLDK